MRLVTRRLVLEPCSSELLNAALAPRSGMSELDLPTDWPEPDAVALFSEIARLLADDASRLPWGPWAIRLDGELVGDAGFKGPPDVHGAVELSYFVRPRHRRRGIAREAVGALTSWSFDQGAHLVRAECHIDNVPSVALLRSLGFSLAESISGALWFERTRA